MEDILRMLLDVVRTQHSATEGTDEKPFDLDDVVDMAMNLVGRPDSDEAVKDLTKQISDMVSNMAPDIFPPKTFEQMDDTERYSSAASMIEASLKRGNKSSDSAATRSSAPVKSAPEPYVAPKEPASMNPDDYQYGYDGTENSDNESGGFDARQAADLNNAIYNNFMQMMGLTEPKLEYPFDRSQIRFGQEKTFTEQLAEDEEENRKEQQRTRSLSAWELAQNAIDQDEAIHEKEPYIPPVMEEPKTKSASQLAAEAIKESEKRDREQREIERQAERMMEVAKKRGKDPVQFILHQQEVLEYLEKKTDKLVSFEDYEDLSPEERLEIEREVYIEKQIAEGVDPDKVDRNVPAEYVPIEFLEREEAARKKAEEIAALTGSSPIAGSAPAGTDQVSTAQLEAAAAPPALTEEMLRELSKQVLAENSDMILAENADEDMESLNEMLFENIRKMMAGSGTPVEQESVDDLMEQVIASNRESQMAAPAQANVSAASVGGGEMAPAAQTSGADSPEDSEADKKEGLSAVELARAAQAAAKPEPKVVRKTKSAADLAREAQERASQARAKLFEEEDDGITGAKFVLEREEKPSYKNPDIDVEEVMAKAQKKAKAEAAAKQTDSEGDADNNKEAVDPRDQAIAEMERKLNQQESAKLAQSFTDDEAVAALKASLARQAAETEDDLDLDNLSMDDLDLDDDLFADEGSKDDDIAAQLKDRVSSGAKSEDTDSVKETPAGEDHELEDDLFEEEEEDVQTSEQQEDSAEDVELIDPDAKVLGEHTQEEIDEAMDNLLTLGLEGEVFERAKRMLLLELADSEEELDAWLAEQEQKKIRAEKKDIQDEEFENLEDLDEDDLEDELTAALDAEIDIEEADEESDADSEEEAVVAVNTSDEKADGEIPEAVEVSGEDLMSAAVMEEDEPDAMVRMEADVVDEMSDNYDRSPSSHKTESRKKVKRAQKSPQRYEDGQSGPDSSDASATYGVSVRKPFTFKNSASYMDKFEEYISDTQENRKLSTGFKKLDSMLRYGLHKGSYFIDSDPQYLKNGFMQLIADRAAETGVDVLYISTELSRYDLMLDTVSRLSYEMNGHDSEKAVSVMDIMTGEDGADLASLKDELNWYRGRISEHLFLLDQEAVEEFVDSMEDANPARILEEMIRSIVREGSHKPVVFIDNIENIMVDATYESMRPFMEGIRKLAKELGIPIVMAYGYAQIESEAELYPEEKEFHEFLGNLCDVYLELNYADMITEDSIELSSDDIRDMMEEGETLLVDVKIHRNRRHMKASCQIQATPKYNYYEE